MSNQRTSTSDANSQRSGVGEASDIDNLAPNSETYSGNVSTIGSGNEEHTVDTLHARIQILELTAKEGMEKLSTIQDDVTSVKKYMERNEINISNMQTR